MSQEINAGAINSQLSMKPSQELGRSQLYAVLPMHLSIHLQGGPGSKYLKENREKIATIIGRSLVPMSVVEEVAQAKMTSGAIRNVTANQVAEELKQLGQLAKRLFPDYEG